MFLFRCLCASLSGSGWTFSDFSCFYLFFFCIWIISGKHLSATTLEQPSDLLGLFQCIPTFIKNTQISILHSIILYLWRRWRSLISHFIEFESIIITMETESGLLVALMIWLMGFSSLYVLIILLMIWSFPTFSGRFKEQFSPLSYFFLPDARSVHMKHNPELILVVTTCRIL